MIATRAALSIVAIGWLVRRGFMARQREQVARRVGARHPSGRSTSTAAAPPAWFVRLLADAAVPVEPARVWRMAPAAVAVPLVAAALGGVAFALVLGVGTVAAAWVALRARRGRAALLVDRALPGALEAVARSLRSGASLPLAIAEAAEASAPPLAVELRRVVDEVEAGAPLRDAFDRLATRQPSTAVRLAVAAMALGVETGGAPARAIDGLAATLRDRLAVEAEARALSSQARASAVVIGVAPIAFGGMAAMADARTASFLVRTPLGLSCLTGGLALNGVSWLWMRRLVQVPS